METFIRANYDAGFLVQYVYVVSTTARKAVLFLLSAYESQVWSAAVHSGGGVEWRGDEDYADSLWHYVAFEAPAEYLISALWCALSSDFGSIEPSPTADIYLFNLDKEVMVFPYDDRGMDIVGPNKQFLKDQYDKFGHYLLDYDREAMDAVFG